MRGLKRSRNKLATAVSQHPHQLKSNKTRGRAKTNPISEARQSASDWLENPRMPSGSAGALARFGSIMRARAPALPEELSILYGSNSGITQSAPSGNVYGNRQTRLPVDSVK